MAGSNINQLCVHGRCDDCPECVRTTETNLYRKKPVVIQAMRVPLEKKGELWAP
jgi:hypothetical protein